MATLSVVKGPDQGSEWIIAEGETSVGRQGGNKIIVSDPKISRHHFSVFLIDGRASLVNRSRTHGTYVNGMRVEQELELEDADQIKAGDTTLSFSRGESAKEIRIAESTTASRGQAIRLDDSETGAPERFEAVADPREQSLPSLPAGSADSEKVKQVYERLVLIQEIGKQLVTQLDLKRLFGLILEKVFDLMRVDTGAVLLFEPKRKLVAPVAVRNRKGPLGPENLNVSRSMIQYAVRHRMGVLSSDTQHDERFQEQMSIIARGIRSAMCVPMVHAEDVLGVIYIDNNITDYAFTKADLNLLTTLANQAAVAVRNAKLCDQIVRDETQKANLSRYLTPALVEQISNEGFKIGLGGEKVEAAILFSDIRGFTALSESLAPENVVSMLNHYFSEMTEIVFQYQGTLDKYVGDAIIAAFGSPVSDSEACLNALRCAAVMQARLKDITLEGPAFTVGIGLHYGEIIHGNVGSERIMQYTVIGDTVNTASRFCGVAEGGQIIISRAVLEKLGREVEVLELEPARLKGKAEPVEIFAFTGDPESLA